MSIRSGKSRNKRTAGNGNSTGDNGDGDDIPGIGGREDSSAASTGNTGMLVDDSLMLSTFKFITDQTYIHCSSSRDKDEIIGHTFYQEIAIHSHNRLRAGLDSMEVLQGHLSLRVRQNAKRQYAHAMKEPTEVVVNDLINVPQTDIRYDPEAFLIMSERDRIVEEAILALDTEDAEIFVARARLRMTYPQIVQMLKEPVTPEAVRQRFERICQRLRQIVNDAPQVR